MNEDTEWETVAIAPAGTRSFHCLGTVSAPKFAVATDNALG